MFVFLLCRLDLPSLISFEALKLSETAVKTFKTYQSSEHNFSSVRVPLPLSEKSSNFSKSIHLAKFLIN